MKYAGNEQGIALVVAVIGLVVGGTVIIAFAALSMVEHRQASNTRRMEQAFAAAEQGLAETVGNWNASSLNGLAVNDSALISGSTPSESGRYNGTVRRLNDELFMIDIVGTDSVGVAQQRVGGLVRLRVIDINTDAALTTRGPTRIGGSTQVDGNDEAPFGWAGCTTDSALAGITVSDAADLETIGACSGASCIDGQPPVGVDPAIDDSTFFKYGDLEWEHLVAMANKVLLPGTYTGVAPSFNVDASCDFSSVTNWGDPLTPTSACGGYFPIMYSPGDLSINGDYGQGMLLVEGNLSVQGGFQFFGVVIVKQTLKTTGTGGHFNGVVLAANVDLDENRILGNARVQYSSCAMGRALENASPGALLRSRGWLHTY